MPKKTSFNVQDEDDRTRYRRERLGLPSRLDRLIAPAIEISGSDLELDVKHIIAKMARCLLQVEKRDVG